jgi:hypothetical protein
VEFEKSERMDHTCREVTLSQYNSSPRRLNCFVQGVLQMFLSIPLGFAASSVRRMARHAAARDGHVAPLWDKKAEM